MPELAEVEHARRFLHARWVGRAATRWVLQDPALISSPQERDLIAALSEAVVVDVKRRGKHLWVETEDGALLFHLRMTGKLTIAASPEQAPFTRAAWQLPEVGWLCFQDARRLGTLEHRSLERLLTTAPLNALGPEPHDLDGAALLKRLNKRKRHLKALLLDQSVIAGVGNIAISEVFWQVGLHPELRADKLTLEQADTLMNALIAHFDALLEADADQDEIIYVNQDKTQNPFLVYLRLGQPCPRCQTPLERLSFGGRSTYYCPRCQPKAT